MQLLLQSGWIPLLAFEFCFAVFTAIDFVFCICEHEDLL